MTVGYNPKIVTEGLVAYYDANNPKSYSPNVFPYPTDIYSWTQSGNASTLSRDTTLSSPVGNTPLKMAQTGNDPYTLTYSSLAWNLSAAAQGDVWTLSVWVRASAPTTIEGPVIFEATSAGTMTNGTSGSFSIGTTWQRISISRTFTDATTAYVQARLDGTNSGGTGITVWWDGFQLERASSATTFNPRYNGANAAANLFDLSGYGNTATAASHELAESNNIRFLRNYKNTSNVFSITIPHSSVLSSTLTTTSGSWTFEEMIWTNSTNYPEADAGSVASISGKDAGDIGFGWNHGVGIDSFKFEQINNTPIDNANITIPAQYQTFNAWRLRTIIWDRNSNTNYLYINGQLIGSASTPNTAYKAIYDNGGIILGALYGWKHYGRRTFFRIYNRALTTSEIKQNYNQAKGIYSI